MGRTVSPKKRYVAVLTPVLLNVTLFENRAITEVINFN